MRYIICVFFILISLSSSHAKEGSAKKPECLAGVDSGKFFASFEIINPNQNAWTVGDKNYKNNEINYSWNVEPGFIKNGVFIPEKYAFGLGHRNEYIAKGAQAIPLQALLNEVKSSGTIYLNNKDKLVRREISEDLENIQIYLLLTQKEIVLYSRSLQGKDVLFTNQPTHVRMTMRTPYESQSYSCLAEIYYQQHIQ